MITFEEIALNEALKIVKRAADNIQPKQPSALPTPKINTSNSIGEIEGYPVVKSKHVHQVRQGELDARDSGVRDSILIKAIKKAIKKGFSKQSGKTLITFKNKKKKYDMLVAKWENNAILIITVIQESKNNPKEFFTPKHKEETKITTESFNILDIDKVIIVKDLD